MTPPQFVRGAQPSLLKSWQAKFKNSVKQYLKAKAEEERLEALVNSDPDDATYVEYTKAHDKERLLRGVVRGSAAMVMILCRPSEAGTTGKVYAQHIHDLEIDYGMPGKKFRRQIGYNGQEAKIHMEDNRESRR